ncbi:hypothetical protein [Roseicella sp. DB1501]|uniref:hypothetical protein n=1 Tax=Roseicella sp. DB1501 TaxID=2730925 RepID=UPI0014914C58|nr:hypothetical protein [Roseicella sp. DB1501]NOG73388.1 hypothetical protein [Roseicella sp. DB1501]
MSRRRFAWLAAGLGLALALPGAAEARGWYGGGFGVTIGPVAPYGYYGGYWGPPAYYPPPVYYVPPPVIYAPPPVIYAPPAGPQWIVPPADQTLPPVAGRKR